MSNCDEYIHNTLKEMGDLVCGFCDKKIVDSGVKIDTICCENKELIDDNEMNVCIECGVIDSYNYALPYVDFNENKYKIRRKSIYHRKYHIQNTVSDICSQHKLQILKSDTDKIYSIFDEIDKILPQINDNRKRMISNNFILKQLFEMMNLPAKEYVSLSKSKRTLALYRQYWENVLLLIGDRIDSIMN